jgi:hypothetical protein
MIRWLMSRFWDLFGPMVETFSVTVVVPLAPLRVAGLKEQLAVAGKPEHE